MTLGMIFRYLGIFNVLLLMWYIQHLANHPSVTSSQT